MANPADIPPPLPWEHRTSSVEPMPRGYNNYLNSLREICQQVGGHSMSPRTLSEWIQLRFGTGEKQATKIESFLRRIEVVESPDHRLKVGERAAQWIESEDDGMLLAFLHSRIQFFGEMLSEISEQPRSSEELRKAAANYGFNWTTRTQIVRRRGWFQSAGMITPLDGGALTITEAGRDLLSKLEIHQPSAELSPTQPRSTSTPLATIPYRSPTRQEVREGKRVFEVDPELIDRGVEAHMNVQDELAEAVRSAGLVPRSPTSRDLEFDVAWEMSNSTFVAEVKSVTEENEERQLRLGLGQVLSYAFLLGRSGAKEVQAVLAVEREPERKHWVDLCKEHGVILTWPEKFKELFND